MKRKRLQTPRQINIKKTFYIATEGTSTEPVYFEYINRFREDIQLKIIGVGRSPKGVQSKFENQIKGKKLNRSDKTWIVVDRDIWDTNELNNVQRWANENNCGFSLSNPCFELWLILHFENKTGFIDSKQCKRYFEANFCDKHKKPKYEELSDSVLKLAISRAKKRYGPQESNWPQESGCTTVYRLVESFLS